MVSPCRCSCLTARIALRPRAACAALSLKERNAMTFRSGRPAPAGAVAVVLGQVPVRCFVVPGTRPGLAQPPADADGGVAAGGRISVPGRTAPSGRRLPGRRARRRLPVSLGASSDCRRSPLPPAAVYASWLRSADFPGVRNRIPSDSSGISSDCPVSFSLSGVGLVGGWPGLALPDDAVPAFPFCSRRSGRVLRAPAGRSGSRFLPVPRWPRSVWPSPRSRW